MVCFSFSFNLEPSLLIILKNFPTVIIIYIMIFLTVRCSMHIVHLQKQCLPQHPVTLVTWYITTVVRQLGPSLSQTSHPWGAVLHGQCLLMPLMTTTLGIFRWGNPLICVVVRIMFMCSHGVFGMLYQILRWFP